MAYVAISRQLISDTVSHIRSMRNKEVSALGANVSNQAIAGVDDPVVNDLVWGKHIHLKGQLPEEWMLRFESMDVRIDFKHNEQDRHTTFTLRPAAGERFLVPHNGNHGYSNARYAIGEDHGFAKTVAAAWIEREKLALDVRDKWDKVETQVRQFLESIKSLNEGLKLWPALALYIGDSYIDRVNNGTKQAAKVSRAEEVLASIDTDSITAAAVNAKLTV
jgi:hypothetical protein